VICLGWVLFSKTGIKITVFLILKAVLLFSLEIYETLAGESGLSSCLMAEHESALKDRFEKPKQSSLDK